MENDMFRTLIIMWFDTHQWILSSLSGGDESEFVAVLCSLEQVLQATALPSLSQRTGSTLDQTLEASLVTSCHLDFFQADRKCNHRYFRLEAPLVVSNLTCGQRIQAALKDVLCVEHKQNGKIPRTNIDAYQNIIIGGNSCLSMIKCLFPWFGGFIHSSMDESVLAIVTCVSTSFHSTIIY